MIKQLRIKFIIITMSVLLLVFGVIFLTLNLFMQNYSIRQTEEILEMIARQDGILTPAKEVDSLPEMGMKNNQPIPDLSFHAGIGGYFYVKFDHDDKVLESNVQRIFDFSEQDAFNYAETALAKGLGSGELHGMQYLAASKDYGTIVVFSERSVETRMLSQLTTTSLYVALASFIVMLLVVILLSRWVVAPVREAFERQRRFVADASHELKTPLTIISANADILESELGENKQIASIKSQSARMNLLIKDLLTLAKNDEDSYTISKADFDLSQAILSTTLEFESRSYEENKTLEYDIMPGIIYHGNEGQIKQLLSILIDNAILHSDNRGQIKIALAKNSNKTELSVFNSCQGISEEQQEHIFDRFYRVDDSRNRKTGGYGLGLAIAKSIADQHHSEINITSWPGKGVTFTLLLS